MNCECCDCKLKDRGTIYGAHLCDLCGAQIVATVAIANMRSKEAISIVKKDNDWAIRAAKRKQEV